MDEVSAKVQFNSKKESLKEVADELNDIKMILLSVALKLDNEGRQQIIKELSQIDSPSIQQWVGNLKGLHQS
ncbi:hypothetical protein LE640_001639 [Salmonella enterica]|jgi:hypothetical protein|uniref:Uncharacterized protein n=1 Tax=Salmonella newport TaxID=108619 RepID=A0A631ZZR3_SALNE|nr:hypothetical protein [uncultured Citrobacter sp.]EBI6254318.1 hypothetical protein [Salmonella enterica]EBL5097355.1 hypothetical protein [Salmonella enterica subsp. enterica serovar Senftenberg]EBW5188267.1 hypothetical protein [Salmonella enterica subsp. enterica serovar Heidelberg]EBW5569736.1 hypothetical protein [Salmonella enterica subsp. enterica serovar Emek]EDA8384576.1 hypothetical protein [Salmonella enterica subsp. enterica serovar Corvallis]EDG8071645.1 hypothetical protein [S